ncbi:MAG: SDR family NAD(P)-dependent oxidoreductase, partial [Rhodospirillales bacterium]|nr:SDR family NAD(P)-dependent oxidoreductase [Rhodospirillales bacterium]
MDTGLDGKVAVITGAARGLGQEFALRLAAEGAAVVAADVRDCDETVAAVTKAGGRALGVTLDVADMDSCTAMAEKTLAEFGRIDVLVNNA